MNASPRRNLIHYECQRKEVIARRRGGRVSSLPFRDVKERPHLIAEKCEVIGAGTARDTEAPDFQRNPPAAGRRSKKDVVWFDVAMNERADLERMKCLEQV